MSDNFDWQTEDDNLWENEEPKPQQTAVAPKRPWPMLVAVLLLAVLGLLVYWQFNRRLEALTAVIETDVLSSHNLVNRAAASQDMELLAPLLSAREPAWTNSYEQLLQREMFYDRAILSLPVMANSDAYAELSLADDRYVRIEVAPDMNAAELHFLQEHDPGDGAEAVMLQHTAVYRRGRTRWLLAPPDEEFWGGWHTIKNERLTLIVPERDAQIGERLAQDLTAVIADVCQQMIPLICANNLHLTIRMESDPASLLALTDPANLYDGNLRLELPAPTLVGLPVDEDGYQAVRRGYGAALASALITHLAEWQCCAHAPVYQAVLEYQLAQMGLRPWPVTPATHAQIINNGVSADVLFGFWRDSSFDSLVGADGWQLYAFIDFLMRQSVMPSPVGILTSLNKPQTLPQWLAALVGAQHEQDNLVQDWLLRDWWLFAQTQMVANQGPLPVPLPDQDLLVTCSTDVTEMVNNSLYRYQLEENGWLEELALSGLMFASPLPGDEAVILQTILLENETYQPLLWQDGVGRAVISDTYPLAISWGQMDPLARQLLVYVSLTSNDEPVPALVDMASCEEGGCTVLPLNASPVWSPDGTQTLLTNMSALRNGIVPSADGRVMMFNNDFQAENVSLSRADRLGRPESEIVLPAPGGAAPFWVDNEAYGYVQTLNPSGAENLQQIVLASTRDDLPNPILQTDDLLQAVPEESRPFRLAIGAVLPHPTRPEWLVVMATSRAKDFIFLVNWQEGVIENRLQFNHVSPQYLGFSPDGRYLVATGTPQNEFFAPADVFAYFVHDIAANKTQTYMAGATTYVPAYTFDWSADGRWLAQIMNNGVINLVAPDYNYQTLILHDNGNCSSLAWVNPITK